MFKFRFYSPQANRQTENKMKGSTGRLALKSLARREDILVVATLDKGIQLERQCVIL